ncbi:hypothetical protein ACE6H2_005001 [Prunus campanulata]
MDTEPALLLVDIIFKTLYIYDDRGSRKAVDDIITKGFTHVGCYRLLQWSCLLCSKGNEEVKLAILSALGLCAARSADAI